MSGVLNSRGVLETAQATSLLPADRTTAWNPGIPGGIPSRTTVCTTVSASTYGNGSVDATAGIQAAINACPVGQVVKLSSGNFKITSFLSVDKGIVLRGSGATQTKLLMPVGTNSNIITIGQQWPKTTQAVNLTSDAVKGVSSVTLASVPSGLSAGEIVEVDALTDSNLSKWGYTNCQNASDPCRSWFTRPNRPIGQVMEVSSVIGNTVTFTTPFHISMTVAKSAQLVRFSDSDGGIPVPVVKYAGVEDLYVSGGSQGQGNIWLSNAAYSWIRGVESNYQDGASIAIDSSFRTIVRDSYIHSTQNPTPGGGGYGISFSTYSADNLVENNIVWNMNKVMVMRSSGGGNVVAYNYMEDGWISYDPGWVEVGLNASHMTTPHYELFEGNESFNFDGDNTWGNGIYNTVFRNHLTGQRRSISPLNLVDADNRRTVGLMEGHWWYNFVGNVLGTSGMSGAITIWELGYNPENWSSPADPKVLSTIMRGGNFDYASNSVHWEEISNQSLPSSLYLSTKPAFFGTCTWPWVEPTGSTKLFVLPARARFDAGNPFTSTCSGSPPPPPPSGDTIAPSVPTGLSASAASASQINLSWTASTDNLGVAGYKVFRSGTLIASITSTTYQDSGLIPSTSYNYAVAAYDAASNNSAPTGVVSATTLSAGSPTPPSNPVEAVSQAASSAITTVAQTVSQGVSDLVSSIVPEAADSKGKADIVSALTSSKVPLAGKINLVLVGVAAVGMGIGLVLLVYSIVRYRSMNVAALGGKVFNRLPGGHPPVGPEAPPAGSINTQ